MLPDDPRHGTWAGYVNGCRLPCCREAARMYQKRRVYEGRPRRVNSIGVRRRIQALARLGWDMYAIANHVGTGRETVRQWTIHDTVYRTTHDRMATAYNDLCMRLPPQETRHQRANVAKTRNRAERNGWAPPLAWNDIDNPHEKPTGYATPTLNLATTRAADLEHLAHMGDNLEGACTALGLSVNTLWVWCKRNGHRDLYERLAERSRTQENQYTTKGAA